MHSGNAQENCRFEFRFTLRKKKNKNRKLCRPPLGNRDPTTHRADEGDERLSLMLFKYSDGLIR